MASAIQPLADRIRDFARLTLSQPAHQTPGHHWVRRFPGTFSIGVAVFLVLAAATGEPLLAETITVDRFDSYWGNGDGNCSLREAIAAANADACAHAPESCSAGECAPGSGADTIVLTGHVNLNQVDNSPEGREANGLPIVTSEITLEGNNRVILRLDLPGVPLFRFFHVDGGTLTLKDTNLGNGDAGDNHGGAILNLSGKLTLVDSRLSENSAGSGGAIANYSELILRRSTLDGNVADSWGGGICNCAPWGEAQLFDTLLWQNAANVGGGIWSFGGDVSVVRSTLSANTAFVGGGGISASDTASEDNRVELVESILKDNWAVTWGGGISMAGSKLRLIDSTLQNNIAQIGGGIRATHIPCQDCPDIPSELTIARSTLVGNRAARGGGIDNSGSQASLVNSTLSGNRAQGGPGGGIWNYDGTVSVIHGTIMASSSTEGGAGIHSQSGTVTVASSIIADSVGGTNCSGTIIDGFVNFDDDDSCPWAGVISLIDSDLLDNGGPTMTHALFEGSSAVNATTLCAQYMDHVTDQRGGFRYFSDLACDSGAFEYDTDDRYELSGSGGSDDSCPGHQIQYSQVEHHLLRDEDWVWFDVQVGATYEIETRNLHGAPAADTRLDLWRNCTTHRAADDNSGDGNASKITYTATIDDVEAGGLDVQVREVVAYDNDIGYDLSVTCIANCPPCTASGFNVFYLFDETVPSFRLIEACKKISAERSVVALGGKLVMRAGEGVAFSDGFQVHEGGELEVTIDPSLQAD